MVAFVALGALATFAIFASTTITNDAAVGTIIDGDMGIYPGDAFVGFPPGQVTGTMYGAGSFAGLVKDDAQVAYLDAAGRAHTATMSNVDLGGKTLAPGVYKFDAAAALSAGQLFLDSLGDDNAVWIFQIGSSLDVAAGTAVIFTGGIGNANNVVWQVGTSVTLEANSAFIGNILASASVSLKSKASVSGRVVGLNGGVTLIDNSISFPDMSPTGEPSAVPSSVPSGKPSHVPTISSAPTITFAPTSPSGAPSAVPTTHTPTVAPSTAAERAKADEKSNSDDVNVGMIVGIVVGGVVLIALVTGAVVYKVKHPAAEENQL